MSPRRSRLPDRFRVTSGKGFRLWDHDLAGGGPGLPDRDEAPGLLREGVGRPAGLQDKLQAQGRWAVLCLSQAMDAAGKDGTITHVFTGVYPQGGHVTSCKAPSSVELDQGSPGWHVEALERLDLRHPGPTAAERTAQAEAQALPA